MAIVMSYGKNDSRKKVFPCNFVFGYKTVSFDQERDYKTYLMSIFLNSLLMIIILSSLIEVIKFKITLSCILNSFGSK